MVNNINFIKYPQQLGQNMSRESQLDLFQSFIEKEEQRSKIPISGQIEATFDYCEYIIHTEYDKRSKTKYKSKDRKKQISQDFMRAYQTLDRTDKINYYIKNVIYLIRLSNGNMKMPKIRTDVMETKAFTMSYSLRRWKQKKMRLDNNRQLLWGENEDAIKQYDLNDYIFRGSKNNKYYTFVLQAINKTVHQKCKTVHIGFSSAEVMKEWAEAVQVCIDYRHWQRIYIELFKKQPPKEAISSSNIQFQKQQRLTEPIEQQKQVKVQQKIISSLPTELIKKQQVLQFESNSSEQQNKLPVTQKQRLITEDLVEGEVAGGDNIQNIETRNTQEISNKSIKNLNIFHKMFPEFQFNEVEWQGNYEMIYNDNTGNVVRVLQHSIEKQRCKIVMQFEENIGLQQIFKALCGPDLTRGFNENIQQAQVKTFISSQNAAIMYMVLKPFNRIYRSRDFVFIRHCFRIGPNAFYVADKDIENSNYPPFISMVRGKYQAVWAVLKKQNNKMKLVGNILMDNLGYLTDDQNTNLTLNYLKNFKKIGDYVANNKPKINQYVMFDVNWDITKNEQNKKQNQRRIQRISQKVKINTMNQSPSLLKIQKPSSEKKEVEITMKTKKSQKQKQLDIEREKMNMEQVEGEIDPKEVKNQLQTLCDIKLNFDEKGMVIISKGFIKTKYQLVPTKNYPSLIWQSPIPGKHPLWMDDWRHDTKKGGLLFINNKKIQDQKGVLKFILSKVGKNLLSGKSILNISLPVDIFVAKSNLELFIQSLCYAPILLQKVVPLDPLQKFKTATAFGISLSPLYLIMQKPFNPILGQTFQAWINGCPAYAEQISHHPPICSLLMYGRGYTITGQFQSKAEVHVNSGCGTNDGIFRMNFDDGTKLCFCSAGGEVSGLTYGDRKFNIQGKAYSWSETQNYFVEISYNPDKKGFFSMKKQQQPEDYFQGEAFKVTPDFISSLYKKRRPPTEKEIVSSLGKFNGVWHQSTFFESEELIDIGKQLPFKLEYEKNPLPSDANWREDIAYRRLMQVPRAQAEKERLQVLQRNDRKLRQKRK